MNIEKVKNQIHVTEFDGLDEDNFPCNLKTLGLGVISIDDDSAVLDIWNKDNWYAFKVDGIGQKEFGLSSNNYST